MSLREKNSTLLLAESAPDAVWFTDRYRIATAFLEHRAGKANLLRPRFSCKLLSLALRCGWWKKYRPKWPSACCLLLPEQLRDVYCVLLCRQRVPSLMGT